MYYYVYSQCELCHPIARGGDGAPLIPLTIPLPLLLRLLLLLLCPIRAIMSIYCTTNATTAAVA